VANKYDDILKRLDEIETLKASAIEELLNQRQEIDAKLASWDIAAALPSSVGSAEQRRRLRQRAKGEK